MYTMKEMTALIGVSDTTLKRYEALGVIPGVIRTDGGQRRYSDIHLQGFKAIRALLQGFPTKDVYNMLSLALAKKISDAYWIIAKNQRDILYQKERLEKNQKFVLNLPEKRILQERMRIGELAKFAQVETSAIRYWESRGLLTSERDPENGYRYYSKNNIRKATIIPFLRKTVYQVEEIRRILEGVDSDDFKRLKKHYEEVVEKNDMYLAKQINGIKEFKIYCDMLEAVLD